MNSLTTWREIEYFEQRLDHYFLVSTLSPMLKVCKVHYDRGYWFDVGYGHIKAHTTPCVSLNDLNGLPVYYKDHPKIKGVIGGYGIIRTPFIYVFWGQIPMRNDKGDVQGIPCALPDNYNIIPV